VRRGCLEKALEETPAGVVMNEVMGQKAGRLVRVDHSAAAGRKVLDDGAEGLDFSHEPSPTPPVDDVDMGVGLAKSGHGFRCGPRPEGRKAVKSEAGQVGNQLGIDAVPRGYEDRHGSFAEKLAHAPSARSQVGAIGSDGPCGAEFAVLSTVSRMIEVGETVLDGCNRRIALDCRDKARLGTGGYHGKGQRKTIFAPEAHEAIKGGRGPDRIVVAPP
jgi:hypothetical protein